MEVEKLQKEAKDKKKKSKDDDSDFITDIIGQFGPFHAVTYSIMGLSLMIHCWQMMVNKFYTYKTDFYCARPPDLNHWSLDQWRNFSAPKVLDDYDRCTTFHVNYSTIEIRPQENTTLLSCNAWEYDTEYFEQTIIQRWDMVCGNYNNFPRLVQIVFFFGNMCGVLAIGPLSDWYGRKTAYLTALTIWSGITIIGYFVNHPYLWIATRFIAGASSLAYNTAVDVYRVEFTSGKWRSAAGHWFGELPWTLGHLTLGLLVYLIPNMSHLELFIGLSALPFMPLWYFLPESPRWLISKGRKSEAIEVLKIACKWNNKPLEKLEKMEKELEDDINEEEVVKGTFLDLMRFPALRRNALCMSFCWCAFAMGYFGLIYNTPAADWNIYLVFVFPALPGIPFAIIQPYFENKLGRKIYMTGPLLGAGLALILTSVIPSGVPVTVLALIGTCLCGMAFGNGYTYTKELFPTCLRTTALALASAGARVGSLSSPLIAMLDVYNPVLPLVVYGIIVLLAGLASLWLWPETKSRKLPETMEEAENVAATKNPWVHWC